LNAASALAPAPVVDAPYPRPLTSWALVVLLTATYVCSFIDRYMLGLLVGPIKADFRLSDSDIGLLAGPAFAIFYATIGLPLGWLADRRPRTLILAAGIAIWSLATAASGLAAGFAGLFVARMLVGFGEAALAPCALSMISDSFAPERRGKPVGVYSAALAIGAGLAAIIGAKVLGLAAGGVDLPVLGRTEPWRFAFIAVGLPGLLLAALFLLVPEPARRSGPRAVGGFGAVFALVGRRFGAFGGAVALVCVMTIIAYSQGGFGPETFRRAFGWAPADYAKVNGTINLIVGPTAVFGTGALIDWLKRRGVRDAAFRMLMAGFLLMVPLSAVAWLMPTPTTAFVGLALSSLGIATVTAAGIIALIEIAPPAMRGSIVALYYMAISITGLLLGPTTVGALSKHVFGEAHLASAMALTPALYGALPLLALPLIARAYRRRLAEV
jgi:MFS family permease